MCMREGEKNIRWPTDVRPKEPFLELEAKVLQNIDPQPRILNFK